LVLENDQIRCPAKNRKIAGGAGWMTMMQVSAVDQATRVAALHEADGELTRTGKAYDKALRARARALESLRACEAAVAQTSEMFLHAQDVYRQVKRGVE
jgi:hypothetical protein